MERSYSNSTLTQTQGAAYQDTPNRPTLKTCLSDFDEQLARLQNCVVGAARIADFIAGGSPPEVESNGPSPVPAGYVGDLRDRLRKLGALINAISSEQGRTEANATG